MKINNLCVIILAPKSRMKYSIQPRIANERTNSKVKLDEPKKMDKSTFITSLTFKHI